MLPGILGKHAASRSRDFEAPHDVPIAIGTPDEAQIHLRRTRHCIQLLRRFHADRMGTCLRKSMPITSGKRCSRAITQELRHEPYAVPVRTADKEHIPAWIVMPVRPGTEKVIVKSKRKIMHVSTAEPVEIIDVRPPRRENHVVARKSGPMPCA